ncbi:hypothetical protein Tco_1209429 [Tanacetum coccineum]
MTLLYVSHRSPFDWEFNIRAVCQTPRRLNPSNAELNQMGLDVGNMDDELTIWMLANMGLVDFIKTADPRRSEAEVRGRYHVKLLESTQHCFMPLVIPAAEGKGYERRLQKQSDVLPAKKLRKDHPALASGTGGKTLAGLEQISQQPSAWLSGRYYCCCQQAPRAAATTGLATDVNLDLAGPSHPEESKGSDDSFYAPTTLDPSEAKRWYVPRWSITNDSLLDDGFSCRTLVDRVAPPAFFFALRSMDYDQLYTEFNVGASQQVCLGAEVRSRSEHELELKEKLRIKYTARGRLLEEKDLEIQKLKSKLAEKEAEAAEVIRLRDQVLALSEEKSALTAEVSAFKITVTQKDHDISLLNSRATSLASTLDDAKVTCAEAGHKITSLASERDRLASEVSSLRANFQDFKEMMDVQQEQQAQELYNRIAELEAYVMDVFGRLEREFYPTYLTTLAGIRWLLTHGIQLALLKCLKSPKYQGTLGHALGRAEGLEAGHEHGIAGRSLSAVDAYNPEAAKARYVDAVKALEDVDFPLVSLLKSKKDDGMDELSFIYSHNAGILPIGEISLSFALMNVHARAEGAKKHAAALRQLMIDIVSALLSSQTWVGEASTSVAPLSVEDYDEEDTDEASGSVVVVHKFETYHF